MTNLSGAIVWSATYDAFGKASVDAGSTVVNNLRFPGQYFDAETGLHYNGHRYYEPSTGRYVTEDPIGLFGGVNLFIYTHNSPIKRIDPKGLYGYDVHFGETEKIALQEGYLDDMASAIANADNNIDTKYSPISAMDNNGENVTCQNQENWHFIYWPRVEELLQKAMKSCSLEDLGEALHVLQDFYSHTKTGWTAKNKYCRGHFWAEKDPDIPANYPVFYQEMLIKTREAIRNYKEKGKCKLGI